MPDPRTHAADESHQPNRPRYLMLDVGRLIAAIAVIWLHTPESPLLHPTLYLGAFAVPFFTISAILFIFEGLRRDPGRRWWPYAASRARRIYLPMLVWAAIYFAARNLKDLALHKPLLRPAPTMFLVGTAHHLWYLSFLLALSVLLFPLARRTARAGAGVRIAVAAVAVAAGIVPACLPPPRLPPGDVGFFIGRVVAAAPAVFWGVAVASVLSFDRVARLLRSSAVAAAGLLLCVASLALGLSLRTHYVALENLAGLGFFLFALAPWDGPLVRKVSTWGPLAFGVYLAHVFFIEGVQAVAIKARVPPSPGLDLTVFACAVGLSFATALLLHRSRYTRWLIP
jgi:peptidoglycan/LPS O-acetylase OafA/YrhL